jgi:metal-responsive CopG/Arc/MetJ family transcriptional regulator
VKHGPVKKSESRLLTVWVPEGLLPHLDRGVKKEDSDRSKFVRNAIREKLARQGPSAEPKIR